MNEKIKQFAGSSIEKIASLENKLSGVFRPIKPRKEFVHGVASHIQTGTRTNILMDHFANWHIIAVLIAGMVSLAIFLAVFIRAMVSLLGKNRTV